jgi:hypothetical protein
MGAALTLSRIDSLTQGLLERTLGTGGAFGLRRVCVNLSRVANREQLAQLLQGCTSAVTAAALRGYVATAREGLTASKASLLAALWEALDADCRQAAVELLAEQLNVAHLRSLLPALTHLLDASRLSAQVPNSTLLLPTAPHRL